MTSTIRGTADGLGCNCLIDTLRQLIAPDKPSASAEAGEPVAVANAPPRAADAAASTSGAEVSQSVTDAWMDYADYMTHQRDRGWKD